MNINSINSSPITPNTTTNTENKTLRNEIMMKEKTLNQLSSDSKLNEKEKEKKSQEIKNQIAELNRKLQILENEKKEEAKKAQQEHEKRVQQKEELKKDVTPTEQEQKSDSELEDNEPKHIDMPVKDIQEMLNANYVLQRELTAQSIAAQKTNAIDILETEIKQDDLRNADTSYQKEELQDMRKMENFWTEHKKETSEPLLSGMHADTQIIID